MDENTLIYDCEFSVRAENCLVRANIVTVKHLLKLSEHELLKIKNLGRKTVKDIESKLNLHGMKLSRYTYTYVPEASASEVLKEALVRKIENKMAEAEFMFSWVNGSTDYHYWNVKHGDMTWQVTTKLDQHKKIISVSVYYIVTVVTEAEMCSQ